MPCSEGPYRAASTVHLAHDVYDLLLASRLIEVPRVTLERVIPVTEGVIRVGYEHRSSSLQCWQQNDRPESMAEREQDIALR